MLQPTERTSFPGELFNLKVDIDGDGEADGIYITEEAFKKILIWEATNRQEYADCIAIIGTMD